MSKIKDKIKFFCFLLVFFILAGCGKKEETLAGEINDDVYVAEYHIFHMEKSMPYLALFHEDGTLYFASIGQNKNGELYLLEPGQKEPEEIDIGLTSETWITSMGQDQSSNLLLACSRYEETLDLLELKKLSDEGELLQSLDVTGIFRDIAGFEAEKLAGDAKGNYYISDKKKLYLINSEGKLSDIFEMEASIEDLFWVKENNLLLARLSNGMFAKIDEEKHNVQILSSDINFGNGICIGGREKELLFTQGDTLYTCDVKDETPDKILNWSDCGVNSAKLQSFILLEDGRIAAFSAQSEEEGCEVAVLTKTKEGEIPEKTIITYGCAFPGSMLCSQIVRFNKISTQYHIELKQYGESSTDMEEIKNLIRTDLLSGNAPDIIDIGMLFSEEERRELIEAEVLEDLNPYFDKDQNICREDYLEEVIQFYERDQALYAVMPTFGLYGLVGKEEDIAKSDLGTLEEFQAFYMNHYGSMKGLKGISRERMLDILCLFNMNRFVDRETGECHFDDECFIQVLEFASQFSTGEEKISLEQTRNGDVLFMEAALLSAADFQRYEYMFGEPVRIIGYPSSSGNGLMALPCVSVLAMNKKAEDKEGAWQFIRFLLEEDQQEEMGRSGAQGIPVKKTVIERLCEEQMEIEYEKDEEGNLQEKSKGSWELGDMVIEYYAMTKEESDYFKELLGRIGNSMETEMHQRLLEIIQEEANAYFSGSKSVKEAARVIQNRAQNYINETMDYKSE